MSAIPWRARFEHDRTRHVEELVARLPTEVAKATWPLDRLFALRDERLRSLLHHAKTYSPWHRRRLSGLNLDNISAARLADVPVMTKSDLMTNWDDIVTDPRLTLEAAMAHLDAVEENGMQYMHGQYLAVTTSGSSGRRAVLVRDYAGLLEAALANIRNATYWRSRLQPPPQTPDRQARLLSSSPLHIGSVVGEVFKRTDRAHVTLPPTMRPLDIVDALIDFSPTRVVGYPSVINRVALELEATGRRVSAWDVATNAEVLTAAARENIERAFGVPIRNIYGSSETGTIAESRPPHRDLQLIEDIVVFEPVDAAGQAVPPGVLSTRTLVTNVVNRVLPLIRYELDDQVRLSDEPAKGPGTGRIVADIVGRSSDDFCFERVHVSAAALRGVLTTDLGVIEYQVRQHRRGVAIDVVTSGPFDAKVLSGRVEEILRTAGLHDPKVAVAVVDRLARSEPVQKLRAFVPLQHQRPTS